ncbi:MAG: hypothetical protein R3B49_08790 [Phycisphaerales bacterium]
MLALMLVASLGQVFLSASGGTLMHNRTVRTVLTGVTHTALVPLAIITLVPFVWLVLAAFKTPEDFAGSLFLPHNAEGAVDLSRLTWSNCASVHGRRHRAGDPELDLLEVPTTAVLATLCRRRRVRRPVCPSGVTP